MHLPRKQEQKHVGITLQIRGILFSRDDLQENTTNQIVYDG